MEEYGVQARIIAKRDTIEMYCDLGIGGILSMDWVLLQSSRQLNDTRYLEYEGDIFSLVLRGCLEDVDGTLLYS